MPPTRVAAVTGGNKGLGLAIVRALALSYPASGLNDGPLVIYLGARDAARGRAAVDALRGDPQLRGERVLRSHGGPVDVQVVACDVADVDGADGIRAFSRAILGRHEQVDVFVNNAGISISDLDDRTVDRTLRTNYYGTLLLTETFLPRMRPGGRIVNMASMLGKLNDKYSPAISDAFRAAATSHSVAQVTELMEAFRSSVETGTHGSDGWPSSSYAVSKTGVIAASMCLGRLQLRKAVGERVLINCCCPGYVKTDMTKNRGRKDVEQGAKTPIALALADLGDVNGEFWENEAISAW